MNKELEEFKKEMVKELEAVFHPLSLNASSKRISLLIEKLKPKPEFIEGEIVKAHFNGSPVLVGFNSLFDNDTSSYPARQGNIKNCKKLEALPMNMTKYDGTSTYPDNVGHNSLVYLLMKSGEYAGGVASEFDWAYVSKFQILKDLNP